MSKKKRKNKQSLKSPPVIYNNVENISFRRGSNNIADTIMTGIIVAILIALFFGLLVMSVTDKSAGFIGCIVIGVIAIPSLVCYLLFMIRPFFIYELLYFINSDKKYSVTKKL